MTKVLLTIIILFTTGICLQSQTNEVIKLPSAEIGFTLGTPVGFNLLMSIHSTDYIFKLSGGYIGDGDYGGEFNVIYKFYESEETYQGFGLAYGYTGINMADVRRIGEDPDYLTWDYFAANYTLNTMGFYISAGLANGPPTDPAPVPVFQIGYVYQIRK